MSTDIERRLDIMESKDAIRELTAAYCFAVAEGRGADIVAMFTADGTFKMRDREWSGTERLEEMYLGIGDAITPKPYIQNHVIEVDGDNATGRCGWQAGRGLLLLTNTRARAHRLANRQPLALLLSVAACAAGALEPLGRLEGAPLLLAAADCGWLLLVAGRSRITAQGE